MKATPRAWFLLLLFLVSCASQKPSHQSEADRKLLADFRSKAEKGNADAQYHLGYSYYFGKGVAKDDVEAVKWWRKAAEQNLPLAQANLGLCYAHGRGVAKDEVEAINLFRKAGEAGEVGGFNNLAWILATSENSAIRNGPNAVFFGEKAVAATKRTEPKSLDT